MIAAVTFDKVIDIFVKNWPLFWYGLRITLLFAVVGTLCGFLIGLLLGGIRAIQHEEHDSLPVKILKYAAKGLTGFYVWFFRGTPMMVQAMLFYYGLRSLLNWTPLIAGLVIISVNTGAYMAEIIRSGIQSVDEGQGEAARSLGMTSTQTMLSIILPQAIKNSFPSIGNEFIVNIKDSSMLNVIGVVELFFQSTSIAGSNYLFVETFISTCAIYLLLTTIASSIMSFLEGRINQTKSSFPASSTTPKKGSAV